MGARIHWTENRHSRSVDCGSEMHRPAVIGDEKVEFF
jgi:hypothetical protein